MKNKKIGNTFIGFTSKQLFQSYKPKIAGLLDKFQEENQLPAVVFTINADNNYYKYKNGFTTIYNMIPIEEHNLFEASSITKTFISILTIKLASSGIINLDDTLSKYLPKYSNWSNITIKQLMNMTSGIYNFYAHENFKKVMFANSNINYTPDVLIALSHKEPLRFIPGWQWHYSNTNYLILGKILEHAAGKDLNRLLNEYILHPFDLQNTYYSETSYSSEIMKKKVHGYYNNLDVTNISPSNFAATGSMLMNDGDLQKLINLLFIKQIVLNKQELQEMLDQVMIPDDGGRLPNSGYGAGIFITEDEKHGALLWNVGVSSGYSFSFLYMVRHNAIITAQINQLKGEALRVANHNLLFPHGKLMQEIMNLVTGAG